VIAASPALGFGPDGLHLAFPQHRPDDLGGVFKDYDLVAQSSHNWPLDTAANIGLVGLASLALLLGRVVATSIRAAAGQHDEGLALRVSTITAYGLLTLFNPISMAAHALFFVLLGVSAGGAEQVPAAARRRSVARLVVAACVGLPLVAVAIALPLADLQAQSAWSAYARGNFSEAARRYHDAARRFPFERSYASREAAAWLAAGVGGDTGALQAAEQRSLEFDERFGFSSVEALGLAAARIGLGEPADQVLPVIDRAVALNPHGLTMTAYAATLRDAATNGGTLRYWEEERSVYVAPAGAVEPP
jgi:O-antigen ligase